MKSSCPPKISVEPCYFGCKISIDPRINEQRSFQLTVLYCTHWVLYCVHWVQRRWPPPPLYIAKPYDVPILLVLPIKLNIDLNQCSVPLSFFLYGEYLCRPEVVQARWQMMFWRAVQVVHSVPISKNCSVFLLLIGREKGTERIQEDHRTSRLHTFQIKGRLLI